MIDCRRERADAVLWGARLEVWKQARDLAEPRMEEEEDEQETAIEFLWGISGWGI